MEQPLESDDSRASDMGLASADPMDEDAPEDDSKLSCPVPARRRDIEVVLGAAPSVVEEDGGGVGIVWGHVGPEIFRGWWCLSSPGLGPFAILLFVWPSGLRLVVVFPTFWSEGACGP